jgi:hypothetical protein
MQRERNKLKHFEARAPLLNEPANDKEEEVCFPTLNETADDKEDEVCLAVTPAASAPVLNEVADTYQEMVALKKMLVRGKFGVLPGLKVVQVFAKQNRKYCRRQLHLRIEHQGFQHPLLHQWLLSMQEL